MAIITITFSLFNSITSYTSFNAELWFIRKFSIIIKTIFLIEIIFNSNFLVYCNDLLAHCYMVLTISILYL